MSDSLGYESLTHATALAYVTGPVAWLNGFHLLTAMMITLAGSLTVAAVQIHPGGDPDV